MVVFQSLANSPLTLDQTGPTEFTGFYAEQIRDWRVRFVKGSEGEEHVVRMLPLWEDQIAQVRDAFGREMIPDDSQFAEDGVIFVKSVGGSTPDPEFERIMTYTFGDDPTEYHVRIHSGDTPTTIREGLKRLHPGKNP
jgi:hypothetical protein